MRRPRELLPPALLLLLAEAPGHGYELMERLKPLGFEWNGPGPIYRELRSLEAAGLITSSWAVGSTGPGRGFMNWPPPAVPHSTAPSKASAACSLSPRNISAGSTRWLRPHGNPCFLGDAPAPERQAAPHHFWRKTPKGAEAPPAVRRGRA